MTEVERINADYEDAADTINRNLGANLITLEEANEQEARAKSKQNDRLAAIEEKRKDADEKILQDRADLAEKAADVAAQVAALQQQELHDIRNLIDRYDTEGAQTRSLEKDIEDLIQLREIYNALGVDVSDVTVALEQANERLSAITEEADPLGEAFGSIFSGIADQIQSGNFENIGQSIADVLGSNVLDALSDPEKRKEIFDAVGDLLAGIASLFKGEGGDGIGGALSGIFGGLFGGGREHGGGVDSGKFYLVGEDGPEIYAPGRDGAIIPNSALGGDTFNMTFKMDRMDDRNFVATFAKNAPKIVEGIAHQMSRQGVRRT